jgi:hypothetical protein
MSVGQVTGVVIAVDIGDRRDADAPAVADAVPFMSPTALT